MDIAAISVITKQQYVQQQASIAVLRLAMESASQNAVGLQLLLGSNGTAAAFAQQTGVGMKLDITV